MDNATLLVGLLASVIGLAETIRRATKVARLRDAIAKDVDILAKLPEECGRQELVSAVTAQVKELAHRTRRPARVIPWLLVVASVATMAFVVYAGVNDLVDASFSVISVAVLLGLTGALLEQMWRDFRAKNETAEA